jgi:NTP pyrophosphatase (non-canonical NTP hydrolase)
MTLNDFQNEANKTAIYPDEQLIIYPTLGLTGEAGEVADKVKKILRDKESIFALNDLQQIAFELGDVLWYVSTLARDLGYTLEEVAQMNIDKLKSRQDRNMLGGSGDNR